MKCPICNNDMRWDNDFDWEDMGVEGVGIVSFNTCDNEKCNVDSVHVYSK
tara:strand:+ start:774 stop:923 length:150 start_codon:yes stop_codon:yes gene_type:complete